MHAATGQDSPIFIGGTGRSGTSVMASLLNTHPDIVLPGHENKLIVERHGLVDLVEALTGRHDDVRRHYAVSDFAAWARRMREVGFGEPDLHLRVRELQKTQGLDLQKALEIVGRENPAKPFTIHGVGRYFGLERYDAAVRRFVRGLCDHIADAGLVMSEGLVAPYVTPKILDRAELLEACRLFLAELYEGPLTAARARRWCDDTPTNWLYLDFLHELYPDMKFIHMIRDPRDVVASYIKQVWSVPDPVLVVKSFKAQFAQYLALVGRIPRDSVLEVRLEDVAADKAAFLDRLAAFLGLPNAFNGDVFFTDKVNARSFESALPPDTIRLIETELADWMTRQGYS